MVGLILNFPIYFNFKPEIEKPIHTISCIMANLKKPGLVDESLGNSSDLTRLS